MTNENKILLMEQDANQGASVVVARATNHEPTDVTTHNTIQPAAPTTDRLLGLRDTLPVPMNALSFCCWKLEKDQQGRDTKVPYNPRTGGKAMVDVPSTFSSLEDALAAYEHGGYAGIGFNIATGSHDGAKVGCIDVDHCVTDNDTLTTTAQEVLTILPSAYVEYSPSGTGLHLYFLLPDAFTFDKGKYYINNRKTGTEIYLPGVTKHFMTLTGNVYRDGDLSVTADQLQAFLDTYMARPQRIPATGRSHGEQPLTSILADAEVIYRLTSDPNGDRFMKLYRGEWEEAAATDSITWSQSEADMALCMKLAFYCRGDAEQIDRLFRESGLMRDKWDRPQSGSTYGAITIQNAVNTCSAFYEPPEHSTAEDDFAALDVTEDSDADEGNDTVEALCDNSANNLPAETNYAARIDALLSDKLTAATVLSEDTLHLAAWAYSNDMLRYTQLRQAIPKEVGIRNFEKAMRQHLLTTTSQTQAYALLTLSGIATTGMLVPPNWFVDDHGIKHINGDGLIVPVSAEPLFISAKMENVDDGTEKLEITFRRNSRYKTLIAPRSDLLNKNAIINYANEGLPVSSGTAPNLTKYIAEMEAINSKAIPLKRCIRRAGWVGDEFFPYHLHKLMIPQEDAENAERFLEHLHTAGNEAVWMDMAAKVRAMPFARAMLAASFASPLLYPLQHRNIYYHNWCDTRSGKTAALKFAMSVWGDPQALVKSYFATMVGMEHRAGTMKHLPLALDELQTIEKRLDINNMVYTLGNGVGKTRGRAGGGIRAMDDWRNCILSTGEQPISTDNSMDGINTRLLEVYGKTVDDETLAASMHQVAERNYGFAAAPYIEYVMQHRDTLAADFEAMREALDMLYGDHNVGAENIAVIALADYYASIAVFGEEKEPAWADALELGGKLMTVRQEEEHIDTVDRAWNFVTGWVACNRKKFYDRAIADYEPPENYGLIEDGIAYVVPEPMNKALTDAGFSVRKCKKGFSQRGYMRIFFEGKIKRTQTLKFIKGVNTRVYALNLDMEKPGHPSPLSEFTVIKDDADLPF